MREWKSCRHLIYVCQCPLRTNSSLYESSMSLLPKTLRDQCYCKTSDQDEFVKCQHDSNKRSNGQQLPKKKKMGTNQMLEKMDGGDKR